MSAAIPKMATLRLTGAGRLSRRSLSVPVSRAFAPTAASVPERRPIQATDARWVMAARAASRLQGGTAAILVPEERRRLMLLAERLGLRAFDAALIIAIVQDAARRGADPLGEATESSVGLVRGPMASAGETVGLMLASAALAGVLFCGLLAWLGAL